MQFFTRQKYTYPEYLGHVLITFFCNYFIFSMLYLLKKVNQQNRSLILGIPVNLQANRTSMCNSYEYVNWGSDKFASKFIGMVRTIKTSPYIAANSGHGRSAPHCYCRAQPHPKLWIVLCVKHSPTRHVGGNCSRI